MSNSFSRHSLCALFAIFSTIAISADYYVAPNATAPASPFSSWETASQDLNEVVALAKTSEEPSVIHVANGTYSLTETIELPADFSIIGESRDGVIIKGGLLPQTRAFKMEADSSLKSLTVMGCTNFVAGSGIYMNGGTLDNVRVTKMKQVGSGDPPDGVGVYMMNGLIKNCLIDANYMQPSYHGSNGIGIYMKGGLVEDSTICSNTMNRTQHGGLGVYMGGGTVRRCKIFANDSTSCAAGNYNAIQGCTGHGVALNNASAILEDSFVYDNGEIGVALLNGTVRNCVIYGHRNLGDHCSGLYMSNGTLLNTTISDNISSQDASGLSGLYMTGGRAINNIIYGNGNPILGSCNVTGGTFTANLTDKSVSIAVDSFVGDPFFVDPASHDFRLKGKMSLAVDSGETLPEVITDITGTPRPQGNRYDIGAYEYTPGTDPKVQISTKSGNELALGASYCARSEIENIDAATASFSWELLSGETPIFSNSGIGEDFATFSYAPAAFGNYTITLSVTPQDSAPLQAENTVSFEVKPLKVYVSLSGSKTYPFSTPETATDSLNEAFLAVYRDNATTSEIEISEGRYQLRNAIPVSTPLSIIGAGSDKVTLNGNTIPLNERAFTLINQAALLSGVTVEGCTNNVDTTGYCIRMENGTLNDVIIQYNTLKVSSNGSGGALTMTDGTASHIIVRNNHIAASSHTTSAVGVKMSGGILTDSVICDNFLKKDECNGVGLFISAGTARRIDIYGNRSAGVDSRDNANGGGVYVSGTGILENSHIHHNFNGVYISNGTIKNCLIDNNTWALSKFAGLYQTGGNVINCTIADNIAQGNNANSDLAKTGGTIKNTIAVKANVTGGTSTTCLFNENPRFLSLKKYHLSKTSPAIDAGDNATATPGELDLDGNPRINPIKNIIDIGCFESAMPTSTLILLK